MPSQSSVLVGASKHAWLTYLSPILQVVHAPFDGDVCLMLPCIRLSACTPQ